MGMNPGRLAERLTLQASARTSDSQGGSTLAWADVSPKVSVPAQVRPLDTRERFQALQADTPATHEVIVRHRTDVTSAHRWRWEREGRFLRIISPPVNADERREYLTMVCGEDRD